MHIFEKMSQKALNRILTLPNYSTGPGLLISSGIIDLQNNWFCEYFKHCKFRISVPMSYISFWQLHLYRPQGPFGSYILTICQFRGFVFIILASFLTESDFQGSKDLVEKLLIFCKDYCARSKKLKSEIEISLKK